MLNNRTQYKRRSLNGTSSYDGPYVLVDGLGCEMPIYVKNGIAYYYPSLKAMGDEYGLSVNSKNVPVINKNENFLANANMYKNVFFKTLKSNYKEDYTTEAARYLIVDNRTTQKNNSDVQQDIILDAIKAADSAALGQNLIFSPKWYNRILKLPMVFQNGNYSSNGEKWTVRNNIKVKNPEAYIDPNNNAQKSVGCAPAFQVLDLYTDLKYANEFSQEFEKNKLVPVAKEYEKDLQDKINTSNPPVSGLIIQPSGVKSNLSFFKDPIDKLVNSDQSGSLKLVFIGLGLFGLYKILS